MGTQASKGELIMFLMITEDVEIVKTESFTDDDKLMAEAGLLDVVDMQTEKRWWDGGWQDIEIYIGT